MPIYLPIAEVSIDLITLLAIGTSVGILSGMFGVGGGFLMTPLLIFAGIPAPVAVASEANHIMGSSVSGALAYARQGAVDYKMGALLILGGIFGSALGVNLYQWLRGAGQLDLMIYLAYVAFLGVIGVIMLTESVQTIRARRGGHPPPLRRPGQHMWVLGLPLRARFRKSRLYISVFPPVGLGALAGLLAAIMGVGGGFMMVPAMIYLLRMPTNIVIGTSLFQITFVTGFVTILHAAQNQTVDIFLAALLLIGGTIGAQIGARMTLKLRGEDLRALLALLVLTVSAVIAYGLLTPPEELFLLEELRR